MRLRDGRGDIDRAAIGADGAGDGVGLDGVLRHDDGTAAGQRRWPRICGASRGRAAGISKANSDPLPSSLDTEIVPPMAVDHAPRDGQAEAGAAMRARRGAVGLLELLEDALQVVLRAGPDRCR